MPETRKKSSPVKRAGFSPRWALAAILVLGAFLRLYEITTVPPPLYFDEAMNGNDAVESLETGHFSVFYPQNGGREGLYINIEAGLIYLFGNEAWLLRLPAAIFGILTVWGVYLLAEQLFSVPIGLLASFFVATSFWHINFSRIGLRAIGAPLFCVWAIYLLLAGLERARKARPYLTTMLCGGAVYGLGFHTYIAYRISPVLIVFGGACYYFHARREKWTPALFRALAAFALAATVAIAPLAAYFVRNPETLSHRSAEVSIFHDPHPILELLGNIWKTIQMIFTRGDYNWLHNFAYRPVVFLPVALLFALGTGLGIYAIYRRDQWFPYTMAILWVAAGSLPAVLSNEAMPHALRSILMIPAIYTLAGAGAYFTYVRLTPVAAKPWLQGASAALLLVVLYYGYHSYFYDWAQNPNVAEAFNSAGANIASRINALPRTAPKYVVVVEPGEPGGVPIPTQTVMFMTSSYTKKQQEETNIHYVFRQNQNQPDGMAFCQQVAAAVKVNTFCLQVNHTAPPVF
jgi:4-amino-4-deoxy-L-arabinose transferase-like glycosyltransferase